MIQYYFKQAWFLMKQNPLISTLSVAGTALAISAVMLCVLIVQVQMVSYAPEGNRNRMLVAFLPPMWKRKKIPATGTMV